MKAKSILALITMLACMEMSFVHIYAMEEGHLKTEDAYGKSEIPEEIPEYIVTVEDESAFEEVKEICEDAVLPDERLEDNQIVLLSQEDLGSGMLAEIQQVDEGITVEPNYILRAGSVDDSINEMLGVEGTGDSEFEWNLQMINTPYVTGEKADVKVAVLDSGISPLEDIEIAGRKNYVDDETIPHIHEDVTGHGTGIASIIASQVDGTGIRGMNPDASIYSVKVLDDNNESPVSRVIEGIYWCIENDMDIIHMSFGMDQYSAALEEAIRDADEAGILMVASAGNTGGNVTYPAAYDEVFAVGSVEGNGTVSDFSATGENVDIYAPGSQICTGSLLGGVMISEGTSLSAAEVTGAASILKGLYPNESSDYIAALLKATVRQLEGTDTGILDVQYAIDYKGAFQFVADEEDGMMEDNSFVNVSDINTYEVEYVVGQWSKDDHEKLIRENGDLSASDMEVLVKAVRYPDTYMHVEKVDGYFHAGRGTNYIANLRYLYKIAVLMEKNNYSYDQAVSSITNTAGVHANLVSRVKEVMLSGSICSQDTNSIHHQSLKVLGVALHLGGDTFAHMTLMSRNDMPEAPESLKKKMDTNTYVVAYLKDIKDGETSIYPTSKYEDNVYFMKPRYSVGTRRLNQMMLDAYFEKSISFQSSWLTPEVDHNYVYKLYNFDGYKNAI